MKNIEEKMYQLQALRSLTDELNKEVCDYMENNIDLTEYSYESYIFNEINNGTVSFTARSYAGCGTYDHIDYELPIDEFLSIITGKSKLKYKVR